MLLAVRRRVTAGNAVLVLALLFAMTGGAWAAHKYVVRSLGQISPKVVKQLRGNAGPPGAQGPKGETGAPGKDGATGAAGKNGESVAVNPVSTGDATCPAGGAKFVVGGKEASACNGSPWPAGGTLPQGATETGEWSFAQYLGGEAIEFVTASVSFPIPLASTLEEGHFFIIGPEEGEGAGVKEAAAIKEGKCHGTVANPGAASGNLCVFANFGELVSGVTRSRVEVPFQIHTAELSEEGVGRTGAVLLARFSKESGALRDNGDWAVTG